MTPIIIHQNKSCNYNKPFTSEQKEKLLKIIREDMENGFEGGKVPVSKTFIFGSVFIIIICFLIKLCLIG